MEEGPCSRPRVAWGPRRCSAWRLSPATRRWPRSLCTDWASAACWACRDAPSTRSSRSTRRRSPAHRAIPRLRLRTRAADRPRRPPAVSPVAARSSSRLPAPALSPVRPPAPARTPATMAVTDRIQGATTIITPMGDARSTPPGTTSVASNTTITRVPTATNAGTKHIRTVRGIGSMRSSSTPQIAATAPVTVTTPGTSRRRGTVANRTVTATRGQAITSMAVVRWLIPRAARLWDWSGPSQTPRSPLNRLHPACPAGAPVVRNTPSCAQQPRIPWNQPSR
jgi:hypothetical protein